MSFACRPVFDGFAGQPSTLGGVRALGQCRYANPDKASRTNESLSRREDEPA